MSVFQNLKIEPASSFNTVFGQVQPWIRDALKRVLFQRTDKLVTIVSEDNYLDIDYSSSFFLQQGRSFTPLSRRTQRIHLFSSGLSKRQLENASPKTIKTLSSSYLGYVVLRPIQPVTVGRTFIKPPDKLDGMLAFFPCKKEVHADLCGIPLKVDACPYISQDSLVMACATASLWMSSNSLVNKVGLPTYTTSEITALALSLEKPYGPAIVSRGLRLDEEEKAFVAMGFDPKLWEYPEAERLVEACYVHVESGIAPVLNVTFPRQIVDGITIEGLHAITVVGHLMNTSYRRNAPFWNGMYVASEFLPAFIVNDDQNGLYLRAEIKQAPTSS